MEILTNHPLVWEKSDKSLAQSIVKCAGDRVFRFTMFWQRITLISGERRSSVLGLNPEGLGCKSV
jgi:hypothetical protein